MTIGLRAFLGLFLGAFLSSCIEFERQEIRYRHDASADQIRVTLKYEGIFGGNSASPSTKSEAGQTTDPEELTTQQKEQLESVLKGGRAFFFGNWIFEYDRSSLRHALKELKNKEQTTGDTLFGKPEKKFLHAALQDVELTNLGLYVDDQGLLCGEQTIVIKRVSNFLDAANEVIRRQVVHGIEKQRAAVEAGQLQPKDAPSAETTTLLTNACSKEHDFLTIQNGQLVVRVPLGQREYLEFKQKVLGKKAKPHDFDDQGLPNGVTLTYENKVLAVLLGDLKEGLAILEKKCFAGYRNNALRYLRKKHPKLLGDGAEIESATKRFLTGGD